MSDPVTITIREDSPSDFEWGISIGEFPGFPVPMGESGFASRKEALSHALSMLRMLADALEVGVSAEGGEPLELYDL